MTTRSTAASPLTAVRRRRGRPSGSSTRLVQLPVDLAGDLAGEPGNRLELLAAGAEEALRRAEVLEQRALARRADARAARRGPSAVIALSRRPRWKSIAKRWASSRTRCSRCSASESRGDRAAARSARARRPPRAAWRGRSRVVPRSTNGASARMPADSWPLPPSITIRSGERGEALVALGVVRRAVALLDVARRAAARGPPPSRRSRPGPSAAVAADLEAAVVGLLRRAALEDDHRGDRVLGAEVGDVEALDPHRQRAPARAPPAASASASTRCWRRRSGAACPGRARAARCARPARGAGACRRARRRAPRPGRRGARRQGLGEQLGALAQRGADDDQPRHRRATAE